MVSLLIIMFLFTWYSFSHRDFWAWGSGWGPEARVHHRTVVCPHGREVEKFRTCPEHLQRQLTCSRQQLRQGTRGPEHVTRHPDG